MPAVAGPSVRSCGRMRRTPVLMADLPLVMKRPDPGTGKHQPKLDMDGTGGVRRSRLTGAVKRGLHWWGVTARLPGGRDPVKRVYAAIATAVILVGLIPAAASADRVSVDRPLRVRRL